MQDLNVTVPNLLKNAIYQGKEIIKKEEQGAFTMEKKTVEFFRMVLKGNARKVAAF